MSHWYLLNYTQKMSGLYRDVNQFIYIHTSAAHEESGQHAATLDNDLSQFIVDYIAEFEKTHDIVIFLQADHGMRYGNWFKETEAFQEMKLPAFFLIAPTPLLDKIPNSYATLWHNQDRLNSKLDMRESILYLVEFLFKTALPRNEKYINVF